MFLYIRYISRAQQLSALFRPANKFCSVWVHLWYTLHMHKPKASLPLAALSLHTLHPLLFPCLLTQTQLRVGRLKYGLRNKHQPPHSPKQCSCNPVAGMCCLEGAVQLSLLLQFNVAWPISPARYPNVKEQSVLDFFSCGQDCFLWTPVEASPVALLGRSSGDLVCHTPLFNLKCIWVVLKQPV